MREHFVWTFISLMKLSQTKLNIGLATALCFLVAVSSVAAIETEFGGKFGF